MMPTIFISLDSTNVIDVIPKIKFSSPSVEKFRVRENLKKLKDV